MNSNSIVIMAGGAGTRLWPKSRLKKPKQLYALVNNDSMIRNTVNRLIPVVGEKNIFIATNVNQAQEIAKELPELKNNILIEPFVRNTAPCIGLGALKMIETAETVAFLPSDHYIGNVKEFQKVLKEAFRVAQKDYLVLIGIRPTDPDTGLGYIEMGNNLEKDVYKVRRFVEKPDLKTAQKYLKSGKFLWNGGMFIAKPKFILELFKKHSRGIYKNLENIKDSPKNLNKIYEKMENISFDYAIAEKAEKIAVIPGDFAWSDIGNWKKLLEMLSRKDQENTIVGCEHYGVETSGCLIHGTDRLVATIGLKDIIVVDTPDVVLICHKDKAQEVRKVVEILKLKGQEKYL
ncbi:MAG: mannose-1-phosphate guanylyltransferase [Candidatus Berkelbacteria bacterium]|nr:mannose-1-phosphate guanylyltransferase [Candidatus Berkelbacteria bacterium]